MTIKEERIYEKELGNCVYYTRIVCSLTVAVYSFPFNIAKASSTTKWLIEPSMQYDALNFFNSLIGDEGYVRYYTRDYTYFSQKFQTTTLLESSYDFSKQRFTILEVLCE